MTRDVLAAVGILAELLDALPRAPETEGAAEALDVLVQAATGMSLEEVLVLLSGVE